MKHASLISIGEVIQIKTVRSTMKPSKNIAIHTESPGQAQEFYKTILNLPSQSAQSCELEFGNNMFSVDPPSIDDSGNRIYGPIFELLVDDVEAARYKLVANGCKILLWEGKGKCCYIEDPFGIRFNLYEDA